MLRTPGTTPQFNPLTSPRREEAAFETPNAQQSIPSLAQAALERLQNDQGQCALHIREVEEEEVVRNRAGSQDPIAPPPTPLSHRPNAEAPDAIQSIPAEARAPLARRQRTQSESVLANIQELQAEVARRRARSGENSQLPHRMNAEGVSSNPEAFRALREKQSSFSYKYFNFLDRSFLNSTLDNVSPRLKTLLQSAQKLGKIFASVFIMPVALCGTVYHGSCLAASKTTKLVREKILRRPPLEAPAFTNRGGAFKTDWNVLKRSVFLQAQYMYVKNPEEYASRFFS